METKFMTLSEKQKIVEMLKKGDPKEIEKVIREIDRLENRISSLETGIQFLTRKYNDN